MKHKLRRQFTEEYREQQNSMKRIGLISDTHGTFDQTLKTFLKDVDEIWHAGDIGSPEVADQIAAFKPLRAVYGNIDGGIMRRTYREFLSFECEGVSVLMTHIGGSPPPQTPPPRAFRSWRRVLQACRCPCAPRLLAYPSRPLSPLREAACPRCMPRAAWFCPL